MVALCPTCHHIAGKLSSSQAYDWKNNPHNGKKQLIRGLLGTDNAKPIFRVGSNNYIDTPVIFEFYQRPMISYEVEDGQSLVSLMLVDRNGFPEVDIIKNEARIFKESLYDIEFNINYFED